MLLLKALVAVPMPQVLSVECIPQSPFVETYYAPEIMVFTFIL